MYIVMWRLRHWATGWTYYNLASLFLHLIFLMFVQTLVGGQLQVKQCYPIELSTHHRYWTCVRYWTCIIGIEHAYNLATFARHKAEMCVKLIPKLRPCKYLLKVLSETHHWYRQNLRNNEIKGIVFFHIIVLSSVQVVFNSLRNLSCVNIDVE